MNILGISPLTSSNPASALIKDGKLIAFAEEERFNRIKHSPSHYPHLSANFCLKQAGLNKEDIYYISVGSEKFHESLNELLNLKNFERFSGADYDQNDNLLVSQEAFLNCFSLASIEAHNESLTQEYSGRFFNITSDKISWISHHLSHVASTCIPSNFFKTSVYA